jgi:hypothetical protein
MIHESRDSRENKSLLKRQDYPRIGDLHIIYFQEAMITKKFIFSEMWLTVKYIFVCIYIYTHTYIYRSRNSDWRRGWTAEIGVQVPVR